MNEHVQLRSKMIDLLTRDLYGPYSGAEEVLELSRDEKPEKRYLCGVLFPQDAKFEAADDDGGAGADNGENPDEHELGLSMSNSQRQSSCGISFAVSKGTEEILVDAFAGKYKQKIEDNKATGEWKRIQFRNEIRFDIKKEGDIKETVCEDLEIRARVRPEDSDGSRPITVCLVNTAKVTGNEKSGFASEKSFYQVGLVIKGLEGKKIFVERQGYGKLVPGTDQSIMRLLYRNEKVFASGHGCSADWSLDNAGNALEVKTTFIPRFPVRRIEPAKGDYPIKQLAEFTGRQIQEILRRIPEEYRRWIGERKTDLNVLTNEMKAVGLENLEKCLKSADRIENGINLLNDPVILQAFKLAHKAMLYQMAHSEWKKKKYEGKPNYGLHHKWYPFQIGFILQCLESLANPSHDDRSLVDLLWFPTGGGKTEAYLGLMAFILFLRRLRGRETGPRGGGTAVLTRYTLRLLTLDQFHRTAILACACEKVRQEDANLKETAKISIGLWVGGEATPNHRAEAEQSWRNLQMGIEVDIKKDPIKMINCPWCGKAITPADYSFPLKEGMSVKCPDIRCHFHNGLPVYWIDDDIYDYRPSIVMGTVDKFARLPWIQEAGTILGCDGTVPPPELIIQDELHLISGPLGSLVGLYESAIDELCTTNEYAKGAKIIASTATIRNATSQAKGLFGRPIAQFPPPALDYAASFFAEIHPNAPDREYVGIFAPGLSSTSSLVRVLACLLHGADSKTDSLPTRDPYHTLVAYFNSLRELGSARRQVTDDVVAYLKFCAGRDGQTQPRNIQEPIELTSNRNQIEIEQYREGLSKTIDQNDCYDVVLATNMISAGLDVPRLGLMTVIGQPKTTSEYIQATSRVGRVHPGLVVAIYNWTRSRDRSHYERFRAYHSRLYSEVEPTSVTPFSSRARDKGLHAVLVSILRHKVKKMSDNAGASRLNLDDPTVIELIKRLKSRIKKIDPLENDASSSKIDDIMKVWYELAQTVEDLTYKGNTWKPKSLNKSLLVAAETGRSNTIGFHTLNSMRNVDATIEIELTNPLSLNSQPPSSTEESDNPINGVSI